MSIFLTIQLNTEKLSYSSYTIAVLLGPYHYSSEALTHYVITPSSLFQCAAR